MKYFEGVDKCIPIAERAVMTYFSTI